MCQTLSEYNIFTSLHKFYKPRELIDFFSKKPEYAFYTLGITDDDIEKLKFVALHVEINKICIDIANGYISKFIDTIKLIRDLFPKAVLMCGNIATDSICEKILKAGADILKVGISNGCFISGTKIKTEVGCKKIENIKIGDKVLTHTGYYQTVIGISQRKENNIIIDVNGIKCTSEHKFYVLNKKYKEIVNNDNISNYAEWVSAKNLSEDYFLIKIQE